MSHAIEQLANQEYSFWFDGLPAWHRIENNADAPEDITDLEGIMKSARLDWEVQKAPMGFFHKGEWYPSKTQFSLVRDRDGQLLSNQVVGPNWKPVQNREAFEFVREFIEAGSMKMETCGSLDNGQRVWVLAKVSDKFETVKGDEVKAHLLFTTNHKFGTATDIRFVMERVVCANTHAVAMNEGGKQRISLNHSKKFNADEVKAVLGIGSKIMQSYKEQMQALTEARYTEETIVEFAEAVYPIIGENKREKQRSANAEKLLAVVENQPGCEFNPGTFFNAYNAVTFLSDHVLGRTADTRLSSAWYGQGSRTKEKALRLALDYANAA